MNVAIIIPPQDFRDETVSEVVSLLEKWGVGPLIASSAAGRCTGYHGAVFRSTVLVREVTTENFDGVLIPDGPGVDTCKLYDERRLLDVIKHFNEKQKPIACVGNAMKVLARANVISNVKMAKPAEQETARLVGLFRGIITDSEFQASGNILTLSNNGHIDAMIDAMLDRMNVR